MPLSRSAGTLLSCSLLGPRHRTDALDRVAWLGGCFEMRQGNLIVEEQRMAPRGGSMLGMSRTTSPAGWWSTS